MRTSSHMPIASFHSRDSSAPFSCYNCLKTIPLLILFPLSEAKCMCVCVLLLLLYFTHLFTSQRNKVTCFGIPVFIFILCVVRNIAVLRKKLEMDAWYFTSKIYLGMTFKVQPLLLNLGTLKGSKIMRTFKDLRLPCNYEHPHSSQHP